MTSATARPPHRRERLRRWMQAENVTCTVLFGADHVAHLTGYARYFGGPSAVVFGAAGDCVLVVMQDEAPVARDAASADHVIGFGERGFGIDLDPVAGLVATVAALPAVAGAGRVGIATELPDAGVRLAASLDAQVVDAADALRRIRLVKDGDELEKIGASYELCWLGQQAVDEGAGARALLLDVLEEARTMLVPGAKGSSVFGHVHTRVVEAFPGGELPHHAGHGLGLGAFEDPHLIPSDDTPFEPGMVIAVEPGVYFPGAGNVGGKAADVRPEDRVASGDPGRYGARVENVFVVAPEGGVELRRLLAEAR